MFYLFLKKTKGTIFITAMILAFLMVVMAGALYRMVAQDVYMIRYLKISTQAQYLAEAGMNEVIYLLDQDFDNLFNLPLQRNFGDGSFRVTRTISGGRILLTSVGTVGTVTQTVAVEVENPVPSVLGYTIAGRSKIDILSSLGANVNITGDLYSNDDIDLTARWFGVIDITGDLNAVDAISKVTNFWGAINHIGVENENVANLNFPNFNRQYYRNQAQADGLYYSNDTVFNNQNLSPNNGVVYVKGDATFTGTNTLNGVLFATKNINIWGTLNQNQSGGYPALISLRDINVAVGRLNATGLIYARDDLVFFLPGDCTINGILMARDSVSITDWIQDLTFNFVAQPTPPSMLIGGEPLRTTVLSWTR